MADNGEVGRRIAQRQDSLEQKWPAVHFGHLSVETRGDQYVFQIQVVLGDIDPETVRVELCADSRTGTVAVRQEMKRVAPLAGSSDNHVYSATVPSTRPASDYTPRLIAHYDGVAVPLEDGRVLWQR